MPKKIIAPRRFIKPSFTDIIEKKREGGEFNHDEIRYIVDSLVDKNFPEYQVAALIMAIYFQGMSAQETALLSEEMMLSGEVVDLSQISLPKVDKYSTGGIGDKTSLVLPPLAAACGVAYPAMISAEESSIIHSLDKLLSIPGLKTNLDLDSFISQLERVSCAVVYPDKQIAPVENILYELRKKTATIPSLPLITAGLLSRKLAQGADSLVVDVKWGTSSFIKDSEQARQLARIITRVGRSMNRRCVVLVTDMNQPLGNTIGTALEIKETIELLKGEGPKDLRELILKLGMEVVRLAGVAGSTLSAKQTVERRLNDGSALEKFKEMVAAQGGDVSYIDNPDKFPKAKYIRKLPSPKRGYVHSINAEMIALGVELLSIDKKGRKDPSVGVSDILKVGYQIKQGEPLMMIHYNDESVVEPALEYLRGAYRLAPKRPTLNPLIVERIA